MLKQAGVSGVNTAYDILNGAVIFPTGRVICFAARVTIFHTYVTHNGASHLHYTISLIITSMYIKQLMLVHGNVDMCQADYLSHCSSYETFVLMSNYVNHVIISSEINTHAGWCFCFLNKWWWRHTMGRLSALQSHPERIHQLPGDKGASKPRLPHYDDVIMGAIASQITSLTIVYSTV